MASGSGDDDVIPIDEGTEDGLSEPTQMRPSYSRGSGRRFRAEVKWDVVARTPNDLAKVPQNGMANVDQSQWQMYVPRDVRNPNRIFKNPTYEGGRMGYHSAARRWYNITTSTNIDRLLNRQCGQTSVLNL